MMLMCIVHFFLYQADIREGNLVAAMHRTETESPTRENCDISGHIILFFNDVWINLNFCLTQVNMGGQILHLHLWSALY